jgi:hypothetical protein
MNAKLIGLVIALALLGSANAFAQQRFGRDSVYANPSAPTYSSKSSSPAVHIRPGRSSVYASDVRWTRTPQTVAHSAVTAKPGRA